MLRMDQQRKAELLQKELFASFQKENMYIYIHAYICLCCTMCTHTWGILIYVVQCVRIRGDTCCLKG